jgi:hypothetical protein
MTELEHNLSHSRAAYRFAISHLPPPPGGPWPMTVRGFTFEKASQIQAMQQEYGWAFFARYEGCVEYFLKKSEVNLTRKFLLKDWLGEHKIDIPARFEKDLEIYRLIRNSLHHDDGAPPNGIATPEIDLPPSRMDEFYDLFVWIGQAVQGAAPNGGQQEAAG